MRIVASIVHTDDISDLVEQFYALDSVKECTFISQGLNDTYLIYTDQGKFIARVYRHLWRNRAQIDCEIEFVTYLATRAARVAQFIAAKDGSYLQTLQCPEGARFLALIHCASGSEFEIHAIPHSSPFNYGKAVGLLHNAAGGFTAKNSSRLLDTDALIWAPLRRVEVLFAANTAALEFLRNFAGQLTQEIATLDAERLHKMFIHGDLTGGNGNQDSNGNYTLFDFDCCWFGWPAYDLAVFLWSLMHNK